ncbi:MAG: DegT/DnrJ/EryC1/StrS family aminotransferase, partial [Rikenellaceae bacterium]
KKIMFYATQARENYPYYQHKEIGYNYRMSNICAGIGRGQMFVLNEHIEHHRHINTLYQEAFASIDGITVMNNPSDDFNSNFWLSTILVDEDKVGVDYNVIMEALKEQSIESRPLWKPLHLQPVFAGCPSYVNGVSENLFKQGLCLPSGPCVSEEDVKNIVNLIKNTLK